MKSHALIGLVLAFVIFLLPACGKKGEVEKTKKSKQKAAREAALRLDTSIKSVIESNGFKILSLGKFPSEEPEVKGGIVIYRKSRNEGGMVYFKSFNDKNFPAWHWYFANMAPESLQKAEINEDGLWDIRVFTSDGREVDLIQDESFTLLAKPRTDWIALNGASSPSTDSAHALWRCFDGDSTTTWDAVLSDEEAFLQIAAPFGIRDGILIIQLASQQQPKRCKVYRGDKKVDEFELKNSDRRQLWHLPNSIQGAKQVRLVFESTRGPRKKVISIAEVALK